MPQLPSDVWALMSINFVPRSGDILGESAREQFEPFESV